MHRPSPGQVLAQHYRLTSLLGEGSTSLVFSAENVITGKSVAIKWILPELIHEEEVSLRLLREAQLNAAIDHPNVVNVFDVGRHEGSLFLVMELLYGRPLSETLTDAPLEPHAFVRLMMPVLRGVQAAHKAGVVHRDLKPDNIFLCIDLHGQARDTKVLDFGIAKLTGPSLTPGKELTRAGTICGTPQFMAPEQMRDSRDCDERTDIYALGVILYRAISGVYPFDGETLAELAVRIVEGNAVPLQQRVPALPRGLSDVVMRALATERSQRFASVVELASALEPYLDAPAVPDLALLGLADDEPAPDRTRERNEASELSRDSPSTLELLELTFLRSRAEKPRVSTRTLRGAKARLFEGAPARSRPRPPPPPRAKPTGQPQRVSQAAKLTDQRASPGLDLLRYERRASRAPQRRLTLPPLPPPTPAQPVKLSDELDSRRLGFRWGLVPTLGLAIALCIVWLALRSVVAD